MADVGARCCLTANDPISVVRHRREKPKMVGAG
jgi:hypothetical protein